jgi:hypothetical protein
MIVLLHTLMKGNQQPALIIQLAYHNYDSCVEENQRTLPSAYCYLLSAKPRPRPTERLEATDKVSVLLLSKQLTRADVFVRAMSVTG